MRNWYICCGEQVQGPYQFKDLQYLAQLGKLRPDTNIREDNGVWLTAKEQGGFVFSADGDSTSTDSSAIPLPLPNPNVQPKRRWWEYVAGFIVLGLGLHFAQMTMSKPKVKDPEILKDLKLIPEKNSSIPNWPSIPRKEAQ
jgi:hypothetical protein